MPPQTKTKALTPAEAMHLALAEARAAGAAGDVPVGAVVVSNVGEFLATGQNRVERDGDPTAHAEMLAIRAAARAVGAKRLTEADLYVTLEPCAMCAQAIAFARFRRLVFGAYDPKGGGVEHGACVFEQATCNHRPEVVGGLLEGDCSRLLKDFFQARR